MPYATFSTPVHAPVEILWALLMEKIENPGRFITAVENAKIIERRGGRVLREMRVKGEGDVLREWITHDDASLQVAFELVDHPVYEGTVINTILRDETGGPPILTFTLDFQLRNGGEAKEPTPHQAMIQAAVLHTKELAEAQAKGAAAGR